MRVLYELHKISLEKISRLQIQLKKMTNDKNNKLSSKVFNVSNNLVRIITFRYLTLQFIYRYIIQDGYSVVYAKFFPNNMWPNFEKYKQELEKQLNLNHPNYLQELED